MVKLGEEVCQKVWHLHPIGRKTGQGALGEKGHEALSYPLMLRTNMYQTFAMEGKEGGQHPWIHEHTQSSLGFYSSSKY